MACSPVQRSLDTTSAEIKIDKLGTREKEREGEREFSGETTYLLVGVLEGRVDEERERERGGERRATAISLVTLSGMWPLRNAFGMTISTRHSTSGLLLSESPYRGQVAM